MELVVDGLALGDLLELAGPRPKLLRRVPALRAGSLRALSSGDDACDGTWRLLLLVNREPVDITPSAIEGDEVLNAKTRSHYDMQRIHRVQSLVVIEE
jgi:hypothetical protein